MKKSSLTVRAVPKNILSSGALLILASLQCFDARAACNGEYLSRELTRDRTVDRSVKAGLATGAFLALAGGGTAGFGLVAASVAVGGAADLVRSPRLRAWGILAKSQGIYATRWMLVTSTVRGSSTDSAELERIEKVWERHPGYLETEKSFERFFLAVQRDAPAPVSAERVLAILAEAESQNVFCRDGRLATLKEIKAHVIAQLGKAVCPI